MSVIVPCPGCPVQLRAPESAAGQQISCPKCGAVVDVPARPRPVTAADDDDEEEDPGPVRPRRKTPDREADDPPPRRKKKRKAAKGGSDDTGLFVFAGLIVVLGIGTAIFFLVRKDSPTAARTDTDASSPAPGLFGPSGPAERGNSLPPAEAQSAVPAGWQLHSDPDAGFRAYFPRPPVSSRSSVNVTGPNGIPTSRTEWALYSGGYIGREEDVTINFWVIRFSHGPPYRVSDQLDYVMPRRAPGEGRRVRWLGHAANEVEFPTSVVRAVAFGDTLIVAQVVGRGDARPQPHEAAAFFTNVELTK